MTNSSGESWRQRAKVLARKKPVAANPDVGKPVSQPKSNEAVPSPQPDSEGAKPDSEGWQELDALAAFEDAKSENGDAVLRRNKRFSWVEWSGLFAVVALLTAALVIRYQRPPAMSRATEGDDAGQTQRSGQPNGESSGAALLNASPEMADSRSSTEPVVREGAGQIAKRVLDDAGDGSFALGDAADLAAVSKIASSQPAPGLDPVTPIVAATPNVRPKPKSFARAPNPQSILSVPRKAVANDPEQPLRKQLQLPPRTPAFISFDRIYSVAFEAHGNYLALKEKDAASDETELELVKCIGLFSQCLDRPAKELTDEQRQQITYTLAKLYFDAGHLYESAVYAFSVARSADPAQPIANAAVSLAFAGLQEAHLAHYGDPVIPGELRQMADLCDLVESRGLKHPQLHAMWFATAQRYDQAGLHVKAAQAFTRIPKSSPLFARAQLAAGRSFWSEAMVREKAGIKKQQEAIISSAAKHLRVALDLTEDDAAVTPTLLAGQFTLAEIALRRDDPHQAIELLAAPKGFLPRATSRSKSAPKLSKEFVTAGYERVFEAYSEVGDLDGIQETLESLSKRYGREGKERIARLQTQVAREFLDTLDGNQPITAAQVGQLEMVMKTVVDPLRKPSPNLLLWAADSWAGLAERSEQADVRKRCFEQADQLLQKVSDADGFDASQKLSLTIKRADLAAEVGETDQALRLLSELLRQSPAAVDVQLKVAHLMTDQAKRSSKPEPLAVAIAGRADDSIWGWAKLTNSLARMHLDSDDKSRYLDRLLESGYYLNESRILQAQKMPPGGPRSQLLDVARKHIRQLVTTFGQSSAEWTEKLESLQP